MAPNLFGTSATLYLEASQQGIHKEKSATENADKQQSLSRNNNQKKYKWDIVWRNVIVFAYLHFGSLYAVYMVFAYGVNFYTVLFNFILALVSAIGVTGGAHRLWAHRAYKARWPLRLILMILQTIAFQNHIYEWVRDHRVHHKYTDTDADPHNAQRGFFFSHIGWLMVRKHPEVMKKGANIDLSDLEQDPIVVWQRRLYIVLMPLLSFIIPTWIPIRYWNEAPLTAWYFTVWRYTISLNGTWLVNSAAHIWGMRPYDRNIGPTENYGVAVIALGEGWHNYHHVFPWDYKAGELGDYKLNMTTGFIDMFSKIGWAYDMKTVPADLVKKRAMRTGDGSRYEGKSTVSHSHSHEGAIWGWGDTDMEPEDAKAAKIYNPMTN